MIWLNIPTAFLRSPEFVGSEPIERATWLSLLGYCCEQENGGKIADSANWKDRQWQQTCGVSLDEVKFDSKLWSWDGETLVLFAYPIDKQHEVQAKREGGRKGGKASAKARLEASGEAPCEAMLEAELEAELQRKGKEGKGKEGKGTKNVAPAPSPLQSRLNALFKRRDSTKWSDKELKAFRTLDITEEDMTLVEKFHATPGAYKRQGLQTLLNNWNEEVDRARNAKTPDSTNEPAPNTIAAFAAQHRNQ